MTRRLVLLTALAVGACAAPSAALAPAPVRASTLAPNADELRRDLFAYAADSMLGREAGTPNAFRGAQLIAAHLAALGVEPTGDSGYCQRVPLTVNAVTAASTVMVVGAAGRATVAVGMDVAPLTSLGAGAPAVVVWGSTRMSRVPAAACVLRHRTARNIT